MEPRRPTFSEHWHRVEHLRLRLRVGVRALRRRFRGEAWHVLEDPLGAGLGGKPGGPGAYFRLNEPAYRFVALLDGTRTVAQAWKLASEALGDDAPTQPEAVTLLGQLGASNLLQGDLPEDARALFRRYRARRGREIKGALASVLAIRLPLIDPDRFLGALAPGLGWVFSWPGFALWVVLIAVGLAHLAGRSGQLVSGAGSVLAPGNLLWLYAAFILAKVVHELGHGLACKRLARREGTEAPVHALGVMLLVFMPAPYVDATSAWLIRSKWARIAVGAAGMYAELALAAVAAVVWARSAEGTVVHAVAYNLMFVAGVSTLVFNANPLMKYDGYYMLADLLETPNLAQRARDQTHHLVQRRCWKVRETVPAAATAREGAWLVVYHLASNLYRWVVFVAITLFVMDQWLLAGAAIGVFILIAQGVAPLGKLGVFLASSPRLNKSRALATWTTLAAAGAALAAVGLVPVPDRVRLHGVVEAEREAGVFAPEDGFVRFAAPLGPCGHDTPVVVLENDALRSELDAAGARVSAARLSAARARVDDPLRAGQEEEKATLLERQRDELTARVRALEIRVGEGLWCGLDESVRVGSFVQRGQRLGRVIGAERSVVLVADQRSAARLAGAARGRAGGPPALGASLAGGGDGGTLPGALQGELMAPGHGGVKIAVLVEAPSPAGRTTLAHAALGEHAGGPLRLDPASLGAGESDRGGTLRSAEPYFEVRARPDNTAAKDDDSPGGIVTAFRSLRPGERVVVRVELPSAPLLTQWARAVRQTFQQRFGV